MPSLDEDSLYLAFLFVSGTQPGTWVDRTNVSANTYPGLDPLSEVGIEMDGAFASISSWAAGSGGRALLNATAVSLYILPSWIDSVNAALLNYTAVRVGEGVPIPPVIRDNAAAVLTASRTVLPTAACARAYEGDNVTDIPELEAEAPPTPQPGSSATPSVAASSAPSQQGSAVRGSSGSAATSVLLALVTAACTVAAALATEH